MCLAIPGKLIEIATDANGVRRWARRISAASSNRSAWNTHRKLEAGDYVLVHVGFALSKVDEEEAARTYQLLEEMKQLGELDVPEC